MNKQYVSIDKRIIKCLCYAYLSAPIYLFFLLWIRPLYSIICIVCLTVALIFAIKRLFSDADTLVNDTVIKIPITLSFSVLVIAFIWVYLSGNGAFVWQRVDWNIRNALVHDLINNKWPLIFENTNRGLTYYLGYYILPSLIGKIAGFRAAEITFFYLTFVGVLLVILNVLSLFAEKDGIISIKKGLIILSLIIGYGGMSVIGQFIVFLRGHGTMSLDTIYGWSLYQYTPNTGLIDWVVNQCLPAWIVAVMFVDEHKQRYVGSYALLAMLLLPYSPFATIGIIIPMFVDILFVGIKQAINVTNLSVLAIFPIFGSFYICNTVVSGRTDSGIGIFAPVEFPHIVVVVIVFVLIEAGIYSILIFKENKSDILFITNVIWLSVIPLIRIGPSRDFVMRASITPQFILMIFILRTVFNEEFRRKWRFRILLCCLIIGSYSALGETILTVRNTIDPSVLNTADKYGSINKPDNKEEFYAFMGAVSYLVENPQEQIFYKVFAKQ